MFAASLYADMAKISTDDARKIILNNPKLAEYHMQEALISSNLAVAASNCELAKATLMLKQELEVRKYGVMERDSEGRL